VVAAFLKPNLPNMIENGADRIAELNMAGLLRLDTWGEPHAQIAELPTLENGLWKVFDDGRMELTYKIRPDAKWHDGTPITSADYLFGSTVAQDKQLDHVVDSLWSTHIDAVTAPDPRTIAVTWTQAYYAATSFPTGLRSGQFQLLPRHIVEPIFTQTPKEHFYAHPYFNADFVHAGPFKVREWRADSHVVLDAFDGYVLGRPKIDTFEVRFIPDPNTLLVNLLANEVDLSLGQSVSPEQVRELSARWADGKGVTSPALASSVGIFYQFMNPTPALLSDVRFRQALMHAFNRQGLADTFLAGTSPPAHAIVGGLHQRAHDVAVKYEHDLRRATQLMEEMGWSKGADGTWQDAGGRRMDTFEVRGVLEEEIRVQATIASEADWKAFGIPTTLTMLPANHGRGDEYVHTWPATRTAGVAAGPIAGLFSYFHSSRVRTAENRYRGGNGPRYVSAELDSSIDRAIATVAKPERERLIEQAVQHMTQNAITIGVYYNPYSNGVSNRLVNVTTSSTYAHGWDAHLWDVR
jgi:ABC-type transport system substrate-binding protein